MKRVSVFQLNDDIFFFPTPEMVPDDERDDKGFIAVGGDLSPDRLALVYSMGGFPWSDYREDEIMWFNPMERFVLYPDEVHVSHSMRTLFNSSRYTTTIDKAFDRVVENCSALRIDQPGAWLGPELVASWKKLFEMGLAHSIEVWEGDELVGGFYGFDAGRVFVGDSMFSLKPNASKFGLIAFCDNAKGFGFEVIDCQSHTPHLASLGARHVPYADISPLYRFHSPQYGPLDEFPPAIDAILDSFTDDFEYIDPDIYNVDIDELDPTPLDNPDPDSPADTEDYEATSPSEPNPSVLPDQTGHSNQS